MTFLYELLHLLLFLLSYRVLINHSFTVAKNKKQNRCTVHHRIRNVHFDNRPQKYLDFMSHKVIFCFNIPKLNYLPQKSRFHKFTYKNVQRKVT